MTEAERQLTYERREVINAFSRALDREAHNLQRWPHLTRQQLYNRLQWEGRVVSMAMSDQRSSRAPAKWAWRRTPPAESDSLTRTLAGEDRFWQISVTPDGGRILAADGNDIKVWDTDEGMELCRVHHEFSVHEFAIAHDGRLVASTDRRTIKIWDASTGALRATMGGEGVVFDPSIAGLRASIAGQGPYNGLVLSHDGGLIVVGGDYQIDPAITIWDANTGGQRAILAHPNVYGFALSLDGGTIVSWAGMQDKTMRVWRTENPRLLLEARFEGLGDIGSCAVSDDGATVIAAILGESLRVWDLPAGEERLALRHPGLQSFAISPDGSFVVSASDHEAKVWELDGGAERTTMVHTGLRRFEIGPDGSSIMTTADDGTIKIWNATSGFEVGSYRVRHEEIWRIAFSPDGRFVAIAGSAGIVRLLDTISASERGALVGHQGGVDLCEFAPDGASVVTAGRDATVRIWDTTSLQRDSPERHALGVQSMSFCPGAAILISQGGDHVVKIWNSEEGQELATLARGGDGGLEGFAVSPRCGFVVSSYDGDALAICDLRTGALRATLREHRLDTDRVGGVYFLNQEVCDFTLSRDGEFVASTGYDGKIIVWDAISGSVIHRLQLRSGYASQCRISPGNSSIVFTDDVGVWSWDGAGGAKRARLIARLGGPRASFCLSPAGDFVIAEWNRSETAILEAWNIQSRSQRFTVSMDVPHCHIEGVTPDGRFVLTTNRPSSSTMKWLEIWNALDGAWCWSCQTTTVAPAVSADARFVVVGREDGGLGIWHSDNGEETELLGHQGPVYSCAVTPDAQFILSTGADFLLRVWSVEEAREIAAVPVGRSRTVTPHPITPRVAIGDDAGFVNIIDLMGIRFGPIVVTAVDSGDGCEVCCPFCGNVSLVKESARGGPLDCPTGDCDGVMRVNPFVIRMRSATPKRSSRWPWQWFREH